MTPNEYADLLRHQLGANVLPADYKKKKPSVNWREWQDKPISQELHDQWKRENKFDKGISILPGKVWHNKDKEGLYIIFLDADIQPAIDELLAVLPMTGNTKPSSLMELAKEYLVEQHDDEPTSTHIYLYSPIPFPKKEPEKKLGLEIKGLGQNGVANCTPATHENGYPWHFLSINKPFLTYTIPSTHEAYVPAVDTQTHTVF